MAVGSGSKGNETVSTVDVEMASNEAEEKPAQAEEERWSSDSDADGPLGTCEDEDEDEDDDDEDEDAAAQWFDTGVVAELGHGGVILVLFETPSGFAIFAYDGVKLYKSDAHESIWADFVNDYAANKAVVLKDFKIFEDKITAIDQHSGMSKELYEMILKHIEPDMKLAVAKETYKTIIEKNMPISCLCPPFVEELMWGLKIQMRSLVPEETEVGSDKDPLPMCSGLISFLNGLGCEVKQDMKVSRRIIETAGFIFECERCINRHRNSLLDAAEYINEISDIDTASWDLLKTATALKILCFPREKVSFPRRLFSSQDLKKLRQDAPKYENKLLRFPCITIHDEILSLRKQRLKIFGQLVPLIKQAKKSYEAELASEGSKSGVD